MYTLRVFVAGLLVGAAAMVVGAQAPANRIEGNMGINHVGITVENLPEAIATYNKVFGFGEAAVVKDDKGQPTVAFVQVSRNTFIELAPATATNRPGLSHFGLEGRDVKAAATALQQHGVKIDNPRVARMVHSLPSRPNRSA